MSSNLTASAKIDEKALRNQGFFVFAPTLIAYPLRTRLVSPLSRTSLHADIDIHHLTVEPCRHEASVVMYYAIPLFGGKILEILIIMEQSFYNNFMNILPLNALASTTTYPLIGQVRAGFPSPAAEYEASPLNIHQWLVRHEAATFLLRYGGATLVDEHICTGDVLVVDRALSPVAGDIIVAVLHGEMRVFTWRGKTDRHEGEGWLVWGVVTGIARKRHHP